MGSEQFSSEDKIDQAGHDKHRAHGEHRNAGGDQIHASDHHAQQSTNYSSDYIDLALRPYVEAHYLKFFAKCLCKGHNTHSRDRYAKDGFI